MRLIPGCILRELSGRHMLMVYPEDGSEAYALEVNGSFAFLVKTAKALGDFSAEDLGSALETEYGLSPAEASEETDKALAIWKEEGLLK